MNLKKAFSSLACAVVAVCVVFSGCSSDGKTTVGNGSAKSEDKITVGNTAEKSTVGQSDFSVTSNPTISATEATSAKSAELSTSEKASKQDTSADFYDNTVFFGNSFVESFSTYGIPSKADFIYRVGLTVATAFTDSTAKGSIPVIDELKKGNYKKIFTFFGENELGWEYPKVFIKNYKRVLKKIQKHQPNAEICVIAITPVSAEVDKENEEKTNNRRIKKYNNMIKTLADDMGVKFIDTSSVLTDENGFLFEDAASDGIHPNGTYCKKMTDFIQNNF